MNLAFVIQRYGEDVAGGAETHCRRLVGALSGRHHLEVLTTCARDYITWANHYPAGAAVVDGVPVTRYANARERDVDRFGAISDLVFFEEHTEADERQWLFENGPVCPGLVRAVGRRTDIDFFIFYSYRYYTAALPAARVPQRAILVPTAEDDPAVSLTIFAPLFRSVRGLLYLTPEEKSRLEAAFGCTAVPSEIIGGGVDDVAADATALQRFGISVPYVLYAGRIDRNKGVDTLFGDYLWLASDWPDAPDLVLAGHQALDIPAHPKVRYVGYVTDAEKAALIDGAALVVVPSPYESLSIIALEAWARGRPLLASARCSVLVGQCQRSRAGLYYRDRAEFSAMLRLLMRDAPLRESLGASGRAFVARDYSWQMAADRTDALLTRLARPPQG